MKYRNRPPRRYRVKSELLYLSLVSLAIFVVVLVAFYLWQSGLGINSTFFEKLWYFPRYCIDLEPETGNAALDVTMGVFKAFFFAALVALFYELYKCLIGRFRTKRVEQAIYNSFLWTSSRASDSKNKYVPFFKSFGTLKARFGYSEKEILQACATSQRLRVVNLATTRSFESYPHDKLAVECYMRNRSYGCLIDRKSPITIVVPSTNFGLSKFGFYLSLYGGFNFISKENLDHDTWEKYYTIDSGTLKSEPDLKKFLSDAKSLASRSEASWVIVLATIVFRDGNKIALRHSEPNTDKYNSLVENLCENFKSVEIDKDGPDFKVLSGNILNRLLVNNSSDGFVMRISNETLVWNEARVKIIYDLAETLCKAFGVKFYGKVQNGLMPHKKARVGFPADFFDPDYCDRQGCFKRFLQVLFK